MKKRELIRQLVAALQEVEWHHYDQMSKEAEQELCHVCRARKVDGHKPGCMVGEVLKTATEFLSK